MRRKRTNSTAADAIGGILALTFVFAFIAAIFCGLSLGVLVGAQLMFGVPSAITFGKVAGGALILFAISVVVS